MKKYLLGLVLVGFSGMVFALTCPTNIKCIDIDPLDCNFKAPFVAQSHGVQPDIYNFKRKGTYNFSHAFAQSTGNYGAICVLYETLVGDSFLVLKADSYNSSGPNWVNGECHQINNPTACGLTRN